MFAGPCSSGLCYPIMSSYVSKPQHCSNRIGHGSSLSFCSFVECIIFKKLYLGPRTCKIIRTLGGCRYLRMA